MTNEQLAKPDNEADQSITITISGNRLVSVLNALDAALHESGRYRFEGDTVVGLSDYYAAIRETTEAMRDELSRQRNFAKFGIALTKWEIDNWSRLATAAYAAGRNDVGHRYSAAAALPIGHRFDCKTYDGLMKPFRQWLAFNIMPTLG